MFDVERDVYFGKRNRAVKIYFLKLPAKRFWLTSKGYSWFNKVVY